MSEVTESWIKAYLEPRYPRTRRALPRSRAYLRSSSRIGSSVGKLRFTSPGERKKCAGASRSKRFGHVGQPRGSFSFRPGCD